MRARLTHLSLLATLAVACSPYSPDLGELPFRCGTEEPKCPDGYVCVEDPQWPNGVCQDAQGGPLPDAGDDPDPADAGPFACNNDDMIEPNDSIATAHVTPIPDSQFIYALATLAICPEGDVDVFRLRVASADRNNIYAKVTESRAQGDLILEILSGTGATIATGEYTSSTVLEVTLPNASNEEWYVQVRGAEATTQNNFRLDIELRE